ncbi:hypothetical protein [Nocardia nepalensis]|uniref:hypothetical protein n=1 Tax=Nocardia nepalensis TaxID=3375448 RepID=UPI003B67384D
MESAERQALSMLCRELGALRAECARQSEDRQQLLARIEDEARARRPIMVLLSQLLGTNARQMIAVGLPGLGSGQPDEESFGCPDGACNRQSSTLPAGPVPRCLLTDIPMKRR